ncbi:MAG: two component transcriptional regulator, winged helix family [Bradyrhizobium sp.]|nr:two component transcriptional regulator, winged helix family [Bradyrhizobium sp.]
MIGPYLKRTNAQQSLRAHGVQAVIELPAPRVLIVEDELQYAVGLMNWLEDWRMPTVQGQCRVQIAADMDRAIGYLSNDAIDIFIVDLVLDKTQPDRKIGAEFIRQVVAQTNAGIIVHTSLSASDAEATKLLNEGADDYIQKPSDIETVRARILALWRRIQLVRPGKKNIQGHNNRTFIIGDWRFVVGSRILTNSVGETLRLSPTEHAFLRHICVDENHECDTVNFNLAVLGRRPFEQNMRIDNLVYRLRNKLRGSLQLISDDGAYKLIGVREAKPSIG